MIIIVVEYMVMMPSYALLFGHVTGFAYAYPACICTCMQTYIGHINLYIFHLIHTISVCRIIHNYIIMFLAADYIFPYTSHICKLAMYV